jgi:hypothetical protein
MITETSEYKGSPVFVIKRDQDDKFPFSFGLAKARMMVENIKEIEKFIEYCEAKKGK